MKAAQLLRRSRVRAHLTQSELAVRVHVAQPNLSAYETGKHSPDADTFINLMHVSGGRAVGLPDLAALDERLGSGLQFQERRSLLVHYLVAQHLLEDCDVVLAKARKTLRRMEQNTGHRLAAQYFDQWRALLDGDLSELLAALISRSPRSIELRQNAPFAGVISEYERAAVIRALPAGERSGAQVVSRSELSNAS